MMLLKQKYLSSGNVTEVCKYQSVCIIPLSQVLQFSRTAMKGSYFVENLIYFLLLSSGYSLNQIREEMLLRVDS